MASPSLARPRSNDRLECNAIIREIASGLDFDRPGLHELMRLVMHYEIDTILMANLDRIGRYSLKVFAVLEVLDNHGVKLIIQSGDTAEVDDNPLPKSLRRFTAHQAFE